MYTTLHIFKKQGFTIGLPYKYMLNASTCLLNNNFKLDKGW